LKNFLLKYLQEIHGELGKQKKEHEETLLTTDLTKSFDALV
jgi:hypothetical protein